MEFRWKIKSMLEKPKPVTSNITRAESSALKSLKPNRVLGSFQLIKEIELYSGYE
jgi:hypothetical protein